jgi:hypothetical protein
MLAPASADGIADVLVRIADGIQQNRHDSAQIRHERHHGKNTPPVLPQSGGRREQRQGQRIDEQSGRGKDPSESQQEVPAQIEPEEAGRDPEQKHNAGQQPR